MFFLVLENGAFPALVPESVIRSPVRAVRTGRSYELDACFSLAEWVFFFLVICHLRGKTDHMNRGEEHMCLAKCELLPFLAPQLSGSV